MKKPCQLFFFVITISAFALMFSGCWNGDEPIGLKVDSYFTVTQVTDTPFGTDKINSVAYGAGRFIAVSEFSKVAYSADGVNWKKMGGAGGTNLQWLGPKGKEKYFTFISKGYGMGDHICYSSDAITWHEVEDTSFDLPNIVYCNNKFIASDSTGKIIYSSDGITWKKPEGDIFDTNVWNYHSIAAGNNKFVAVQTGTPSPAVAVSTDGKNWTIVQSSPFEDYYVYGIGYGGGKFIASGCIWYNSTPMVAFSSNGEDWTITDSNNYFYSGIFWGGPKGKEKFYIGYSGSFLYLSNEMTWEPVPNPFLPSGSIMNFFWCGDRFIAESWEIKLKYSLDGSTWHDMDHPDSAGGFSAMTWGNNKFVALSGANVFFSTGQKWTGLLSNYPPYLYNIKQVNNNFCSFYNTDISFSPDGINKTDVSLNSLSLGSFYCADIAWGNNKYVGIGFPTIISGNYVIHSPDGKNWELVPSNIGYGLITFGAGKFVASYSYYLYYSTDGANWTDVNNVNNPFIDPNDGYPLFYNISRIIWCNNRFFAVGVGGKMGYSKDGINWTAVADSSFGAETINSIAWGGDRYVAVGEKGKMAYSLDGDNWTSVNSTFGASNINDISWNGDRFVAVGSDGKIAHIKVTYSAE